MPARRRKFARRSNINSFNTTFVVAKLGTATLTPEELLAAVNEP